MPSWAIYDAELERARADLAAAGELTDVIAGLLADGNSKMSGLIAALIAERSTGEFVADLARALMVTTELVEGAVEATLHGMDREVFLTGAQVVALLLREAGVERVFAYPGTSELALCDAVARTPQVELLNGRGDKESVLMAAGANLVCAGRAAAIVHGARGLTNAAGAVADIRRNEVSALVLVGLPITSSSQFLPPHGEVGLLSGVGTFAKDWWEASAIPEDSLPRRAAALALVTRLRETLALARTEPHGPVLVGMPQDVLERQWVPLAAVWPSAGAEPTGRCPRAKDVATAVEYISGHIRPLILIDDYLFRKPDAREALGEFAHCLGAPVLQVRYTRGAMLFERLSVHDVASFEGWYRLDNERHRELMRSTDLLITLEDRNMYARVVGILPSCAKLAITSNAVATNKNRYLEIEDLVIDAPVPETLRALTAGLRERIGAASPWAPAPGVSETEEHIESWVISRRTFCRTFAAILAAAHRPVIVDDSQMFGGLIACEYDLLPERVRVFGDHGGFVGAGIAYATGLALSEPDATVVCTVGDQGFTNGVQALVAMGEQWAPLTLLVCNNGETVSLRKQSLSSAPGSFEVGSSEFLRNARNVNYCRIAKGFGLNTATVTWAMNADEGDSAVAIEQLGIVMSAAVRDRRPWLVEIRMPGLGPAWTGLWATSGNENTEH